MKISIRMLAPALKYFQYIRKPMFPSERLSSAMVCTCSAYQNIKNHLMAHKKAKCFYHSYRSWFCHDDSCRATSMPSTRWSHDLIWTFDVVLFVLTSGRTGRSLTGSWSASSLIDRTDDVCERTEFWDKVRLRGERGASFSPEVSSSSSFLSREVKSTPERRSSEYVPRATMCPWESEKQFVRFGSFLPCWN